MNSMSPATAPGPLRGRRVRPGSRSGARRTREGPTSRKSEPSSAGRASKALRSATTAPGKYSAAIRCQLRRTTASSGSTVFVV